MIWTLLALLQIISEAFAYDDVTEVFPLEGQHSCNDSVNDKYRATDEKRSKDKEREKEAQHKEGRNRRVGFAADKGYRQEHGKEGKHVTPHADEPRHYHQQLVHNCL